MKYRRRLRPLFGGYENNCLSTTVDPFVPEFAAVKARLEAGARSTKHFIKRLFSRGQLSGGISLSAIDCVISMSEISSSSSSLFSGYENNCLSTTVYPFVPEFAAVKAGLEAGARVSHIDADYDRANMNYYSL
ncbi:hypothetical protein CEXT_513681 [Caerostris extrusa]|uniref:Uncharacterized protein n=1 Tax=Caerostris extrusa TaxID=172846 RepID=A0AAV4WL29_CAEEX|nr:hypothetical protein CEXT_513681 [Caerostris extrusa]